MVRTAKYTILLLLGALLVLAPGCGQKPIAPAPNPQKTDWVLEAPYPATDWVRGVWAASDTDWYLVGHNRTILHYDGSSFEKMNCGGCPGIVDFRSVF